MVPVNYLAVVLGAVGAVVLGMLWYGPLFGKPWMRMMGLTKESMQSMKMKPMTAMSLMALASLVMAYVLSHITTFAMNYLGTSGVSAGLSSGFWTWLGFIVPVTLGVVLWEGKPWKLFFLNAGYYLVSLLLMGAIIAGL